MHRFVYETSPETADTAPPRHGNELVVMLIQGTELVVTVGVAIGCPLPFAPVTKSISS